MLLNALSFSPSKTPICLLGQVRDKWRQFYLPQAGRATKQKVLVDLHQLLFPEVLLIKDVSRKQRRSDAAGEVLYPFTGTASLNRCIVAVGFGVGLLQ